MTLGHAGGLQAPTPNPVPILQPPLLISSRGRRCGLGRRHRFLFLGEKWGVPPISLSLLSSPALSTAQQAFLGWGLGFRTASQQPAGIVPPAPPHPSLYSHTKTASENADLPSFKFHAHLFQCQLGPSAPRGHLLSLSSVSPGSSPERGSHPITGENHSGLFKTTHGHKG